MTSQFKVQGSLKALLVSAAALVLSVSAMEASAQRAPTTSGGRGTPVVVRPTRPVVPPRPVVVLPPCKRGGPGITPC